MSNTSVLQDWLVEIPIRMQSTLALGLRGPDGIDAPETKKICRWLRSMAFKPGNPDNFREFMLVGDAPDRIIEKGACARELERMPQHFYSHLMHALQVVGWRHPSTLVRKRAIELYQDMVSLMHLEPERDADFESRLGTKVWPGGSQPDNAEEASEVLQKAAHGRKFTPGKLTGA